MNVIAIVTQKPKVEQMLRYERALAQLQRALAYYEDAVDNPALHGLAYASVREAYVDLEVFRREVLEAA